MKSKSTSQIAKVKVGITIEFLTSERLVTKVTDKFVIFEKQPPYIDRISKANLEKNFQKGIAQIKVGTSKK